MTDFLAPVGQPKDVIDSESRDLIAALHEHDWYAEHATNGQVTVISPDFTRVMVIKLDRDSLVPFIDDEIKMTSQAIEYVNGE
jgi:hypothetical protein